jgi:tRNA-binding protein
MITIEDFEKVDIRLGKIINVEDFPEAKKPAYKLTIDFGPEIGVKRSSVQLVGTYEKEELLGMLVACVVNFPPRQIGPFLSEVLTLGFKNTDGIGYVLVAPSKSAVQIGDRLC